VSQIPFKNVLDTV